MDTVSVFLAINETGDIEVALGGASDARDALLENAGGEAIRTVELRVTLSRPAVAVASVTVPDDAGETLASEAAE